MRLGVMQPYFLPYLGYFQLAASVDLLLLVDDFAYQRGAWINRNRILVQGRPAWLTLPLSRPSQNRTIAEHHVALAEGPRRSLRHTVAQAYARAPCRDEGLALLERALPADGTGLAPALAEGLQAACAVLGIATPLRRVVSAEVAPGARGAERILALCGHWGAREYLNLPGGRALYPPALFRRHGLRLGFVEPGLRAYRQGGAPAFVPELSALDLVMQVEPTARDGHLRPERIDWMD